MEVMVIGKELKKEMDIDMESEEAGGEGMFKFGEAIRSNIEMLSHDAQLHIIRFLDNASLLR